MPRAYLILDGQWGSTGKGLLAGKLAADRAPDVAVCNFGPNAGHTYVDRGGRRIMTQQLPTGFVSPGLKHLLVGPGAIVDPAILLAELAAFPEAKPRLRIHEHAAVVSAWDRDEEGATLVHVGSTRKGTAAAAAYKAARPRLVAGRARVAREHPHLAPFCISSSEYDDVVAAARVIQVESAQGIELSLDRGRFYPYCTGRNVTPERVLDDCGVPMRFLDETCLVLRTYPIRVGNEYDAEGREIGNSGPVYPGMEELTWEEVSRRAGAPLLERTTVTKKVRRVFTFSFDQLRHALWVAGPSAVFLNFCNYFCNYFSAYEGDLARFLSDLGPSLRNADSDLRWLGFGPSYGDVVDYASTAARWLPRREAP